MLTKVYLVEINPTIVKAWQRMFHNNPEVEIIHDSILHQQVDAWVTPTNAMGSMNGGLDMVIKNHLGSIVEQRVKKEIQRNFGSQLPVGSATCVPTGASAPRYLISTPTMVGSADNISDTQNVAYACAAAFQAVHIHNHQQPGSIQTVALPGLGAGTGQVPVDLCAQLMWSGYHLFRRHRCRSFQELEQMLQKKLSRDSLYNLPAPPVYTEAPLLEATC